MVVFDAGLGDVHRRKCLSRTRSGHHNPEHPGPRTVFVSRGDKRVFVRSDFLARKKRSPLGEFSWTESARRRGSHNFDLDRDRPGSMRNFFGGRLYFPGVFWLLALGRAITERLPGRVGGPPESSGYFSSTSKGDGQIACPCVGSFEISRQKVPMGC